MFVRVGWPVIKQVLRVVMPDRAVLHQAVCTLNLHDTVLEVTFILFVLVQRTLRTICFSTWTYESSVYFIGGSSDSLLRFTVRWTALYRIHARHRSTLLLLHTWRLMAIFTIIDFTTFIPVLILNWASDRRRLSSCILLRLFLRRPPYITVLFLGGAADSLSLLWGLLILATPV